MKINWNNIHYLILIAIILNFILLYFLRESSLKSNEKDFLISNQTIFLKKKEIFPQPKINPNDSVSQVAESIGAQGKVPQTTYLHSIENSIENNIENNIENSIENDENYLIHVFLGLFSIILTVLIINFLVDLGEKKKKLFNNYNENSATNYILMDED